MQALKEVQPNNLDLDVQYAEMDENVENHMKNLCGFYRVENTLLIEGGETRRYFILEGQHTGSACGWLEAEKAWKNGQLPNDLNSLMEAESAESEVNDNEDIILMFLG